MNIVDAQIVESNEDIVDATAVEPVDEQLNVEIEIVQSHRSWPFRVFDRIAQCMHVTFGAASMIVILAFLAAIPVFQLLTYGYLLEVSGRVARTGRFRDGLIGLSSALTIGKIVFGTALCFLPAWFISINWISADLIAPGSEVAAQQRILLWIVTILTILHVAAAWFCGGQLKHFFWPIVAPFSLGIWLVRWALGVPSIRALMGKATNWFAPNLIGDFADVKPLKDWFLPVTVIKAIASGKMLDHARESIWDFVTKLRLPYYFWLGLQGLCGTLLWLVIPMSLFLIASLIFQNPYIEDGLAVLFILPGMLISGLFFTFLFFVLANFARTQSFSSFIDLKTPFRILRAAPIMQALTVVLGLALIIPLFLLNIEPIDPQLVWVTCIVFVVLIWPGKMLAGRTLARGLKKEKVSFFLISYPLILLSVLGASIYSLMLYFTRFTSASGPMSLIENPAFTIPAPFWL